MLASTSTIAIPSETTYVNSRSIGVFERADAEFASTGLISTTTVRDAIYDVFGDSGAIFTAIATCESGLRQYDTPRHVISNPVTADRGAGQVNVEYHGTTAKEMGLDIYTLKGNLMYSKHLFDLYGTSPWSASSKCWKKLIGST